ncbi:hypothetical protein BSL78_01182 [Apostichopus japonicus]|uniref:Uncharacterized protein n=1 Tax=Stichopus japonicus TaxID=307972 RepID=A0A2G8LNL4_STIJA|nr:hypothetical protein BSL78_01182 [Apostichopus japonicus]
MSGPRSAAEVDSQSGEQQQATEVQEKRIVTESSTTQDAQADQNMSSGNSTGSGTVDAVPSAPLRENMVNVCIYNSEQELKLYVADVVLCQQH